MKSIKYILTLAVVSLLSVCVSARQFEQGEKIYVNSDQSFHDGGGSYNWAKDNAKLYLYIFKKVGSSESNQKWVTLSKEEGNTYGGEIPSGEYNKCIVVRGTSADWSGKWNQTGDLDFPDGEGIDRNYIYKFWDGGSSADWLTYAPSAAQIASFASALRSAGKEEQVHICSQALGGPYSLRVKLSADKKTYDYESVQCHGWYKSTDGNTWTSVDGYAGIARDGELDKDILKNNLPASGTIYYYLHSAKSAGRRLIKLIPDATGCDLDCTITFFGVASSEVNANDTTYTLDGMVAFGVPCGDLVIECDGKSVTINAADAKSPQIFSIEGLRAATTNGKTTTATAKFIGNEDGKVTATVNIPNVTQGITYKHIDVLVGETTTLDPSGANYSNKHFWYIDGEQTDLQGQQTSIVHNEPNMTRYTYREFNPPAGDMNDMMSNGNYETTDASFYGNKGTKSTISDYDFWGQYPETGNTAIDFYTNTTINPQHWADNGFAVVKNANNFFYTFAKVKPQEGDYFALFDAASDGVANKKAWFANTAKNPNLKLQKGTTYLFSFWAANINNYGEMDNAAKLQFQIEYNGKTEKLGSVLDLNTAEFRNNRWHQCSATFTADANADNVTISVINLNTNRLNTGNDFALDDIQFRAVSSPSRSVRMQQVFEVQTHEPHIYSFTATTQAMACDKQDYDVKLVIDYDNPKGKLVVKDLTADKVIFNDVVPTMGADWDAKKSKTLTIHIDALEPAKHDYYAYFDEWTKAEASASSSAPDYVKCPEVITLTADTLFMDCDETAYDVKFSLEYINPKGNLIIKDVTTGKTLVNEALPVPAVNSEASYEKTVTIDGLTPEKHEYKAYFAEWTTQFATASTTAPKFRECCTKGLMYRKWENVIFIDNHDSIFVAYQWFRNDQKLEGDTLQRFYNGFNKPINPDDVFYCQVIDKNSDTILTCPLAFKNIPRSAEAAVEDILADGFAVYPTQLAAGAAITITKTVPGSVQATLLTLTGQTVSITILTDETSTLPMPDAAGLYMLQLRATITQTTVKINVY